MRRISLCLTLLWAAATHGQDAPASPPATEPPAPGAATPPEAQPIPAAPASASVEAAQPAPAPGEDTAPAAPAEPGTPAPTAAGEAGTETPTRETAPTVPSVSGAAGDTGPVIELAPDESDTPAATHDHHGHHGHHGHDPLRGMRDERMQRADTGIGGYAELHYGLSNLGEDRESEAEIDLHRLVLFLSHNFNQDLSFYAEVEVEHAFVGDGKPGEVGVEQAMVDYRLAGDALGLRAGIVLVPMGIINQWHEPPVFHGVERPSVDKVIIPTTWREGGVGIFGRPTDALRYELYLVGGLNAARFRARDGLRAGRQSVAEARADGPAITGRLELEPLLGLVAGVSGYFGLAGPNAELFDASAEALDLDVPVWGVSGDVRGRAQGFEARAVIAAFGVGDTVELRQAFDADGEALGIDVGSLLWGAYGEVAYDVLHTTGSSHQLLPFVRLERYDTLADLEGRDETPTDEDLAITELVFGLSYRPISQVVFKGDYILKQPDGPSGSSGRIDLGVGVMF